MSIELAVLGSGSSGNSTLLRFENGGDTRLALIDAGLAVTGGQAAASERSR